LPEDGDQFCHQNVVFNLKHWTVDKAHKVSDSTGDVTSSAPYGVIFLLCSGRELNFRARTRYEPHEWLPYDYNSVMHYRAIAFSKDHLSVTIVPKDRRAFFSIGQRVRYSPMDLAKLNVLYNCNSSYFKGDDVHSPLSEAGKDVASEQDLVSESVMEKGKLSAKFEKDLLSKSGIENDTFPPESGKDNSSGDLIAKSRLEKKTSPPESEEDISSADLLSKPKVTRDISVSEFEDYLASEESLFSTSGRGHFIQ
jgi:hypothetical protein